MRRLFHIVLSVVAFCFSFSSQAQPIPTNLSTPRGDMSGLWLSYDQPAHAVQVEILNGARAQIGWYSYDSSGNPLWLIGLGRVVGDSILTELVRFQGGRPPPNWNDANPMSSHWGNVTLRFEGCDTAVLSWDSDDPDFLSGDLELTRYALLQGQRCFTEDTFSQQIIFSFERRMHSFTAIFADMPENYSTPSYDLDYRREELPGELYGRYGLRLSGNNQSEDLAMLVKAPIPGLLPAQYYRVEIESEIATNAPTGCSGAGGAPGEDVYIKLGASGVEPVASVSPVDGWLRLNVDYGSHSQAGANARVVGNLANSHNCDPATETPWELKTVTTKDQPMIIQTDSSGTLWVLVGSDSAYVGLSQFYITAIQVRLEPYSY